ncbi:Ig-like domain-containing protein [Nocardioides agariphilus]|uniref:Ig-like domain-containing protein n=1 Tax=Nocardioides agariphilus TaxID=433664 RepID=A0A930VIY6_9ACTN|nr:Ig-like domain-containing protein [Nocardioides agariphilus]MBF4767568.1 Ig-like domain-containing protein [Nocardioides agariphilus]
MSLLVAAGGLSAAVAPAHAARSSFASTTAMHLGGEDNEFANSGIIDIYDQNKPSPYPSMITVPDNVTITDVDLKIRGLTHPSLGDVDMMLVGPGGEQATFMSDAGGTTAASNLSLTFDDDAAQGLPETTAVSNGTYATTNYEFPDFFPAPAPESDGGSVLSVFNGTDAKGVWSLYIMDDLAFNSGTIANGWALVFDFEPTHYPSPISVSGLGAVTDVNVTLHDVNSTYSNDLDVLLVGPQGQQATLISDAGFAGHLVDADITLDDEASALLPENSFFGAGTYKPVDYGTFPDPYPAPAPTSTGSFALSVFDGTNPNGVWTLYAVDDGPGDITKIDGGWSLDLSWADPTAPTGTVSIAGGATRTNKRSVVLNLSASDPSPSSGVTQMRFSNDGLAFTDYQPYAATATWTLSVLDGTKRVYAQFKDADGNQSIVVSDTIALDTKAPLARKLTPAANATKVPRGTSIKIRASEKLAAATVNGTTVFLTKQGVSGRVTATVKYVATSATIVLTPRRALASHATYVVTVRGVKDPAGNRWDQQPKKQGAQPLRYTFQTA